MRANEFLVELFQGQKNWQWMFRGSEEVQAKFEVDGVEYSYLVYEYKPGRWEIDFSNRGEQNQNKPYGITGTGNAAEVFGTVVDITRSFLQQYPHVKLISFSADEPSRQKLYARMAQRLLPDWKLERTGRNFYLTRPVQET